MCFISLDYLIIPHLKTLKSDDYIIDTKEHIKLPRQLQTILDDLFNQDIAPKETINKVVNTLRHTFASHLAIKGTPIYTIQKLMNHKSISQTVRYAKLSPNSGLEEVNQISLF